MTNKLAQENPYAGFIDHHLRIGDTFLFVPPTSINVSHSSEIERGYTMRSKSLSPKASGYTRKIIDMDLFFVGEDFLRGELRDIMRQIKLIPFLPIENFYLNEIHKIEGIAVKSFTMKSVRGFPNAVQVHLHAEEFDPFAYIATEGDDSFEDLINWPLYRWYYKRGLEDFDKMLEKQFGRNGKQYMDDLFIDTQGEYYFETIDEEYLEKLENLTKKKKGITKSYREEINQPLVDKQEYQQEYDKEMENIEKEIAKIKDEGAAFDPMFFPDLHLVELSANFSNILSPIQLQMNQSPTFQFLGSTDSSMRLSFETTDEESIGGLVRMLERVRYLARRYRSVSSAGGLKFHSPLTNLLGASSVIVEDFNVYTSSNQTGVYFVDMDLLAYDRGQERMADVNWVTSQQKTPIDQKKTGNPLYDFYRLATLPVNTMVDMFKHGTDVEEYQIYDLMTNNSSHRTPIYQQYLAGEKNDAGIDMSDNLQQKIAYEDEVKGLMKGIDLYPDLDLPTYGEVQEAGFNIENPNNALYVDPDFYYNYNKIVTMPKKIEEALEGADGEGVFRDHEGGSVSTNGLYGVSEGGGGGSSGGSGSSGGDVSASSVKIYNTEDDMKEYAKEKGLTEDDYEIAIDENTNKKYVRISEEAAYNYIIEEAERNGIPKELALTAATFFNPSFQQFYDEGYNENLEGVVSPNGSYPKYVSRYFNFMLDDIGKDYFSGVMNVPRRFYENNRKELVEFDTISNIEEGVSILADIYKKLKAEKEVDSAVRGVTPKEVEEAFKKYKYIPDNEEDSEEDYDVVVATLAYYFGLENEMNESVSEAADPKSREVNEIRKMGYLYNEFKEQEKMEEYLPEDEEFSFVEKNELIKDMTREASRKSEAARTGISPDEFDISDSVIKDIYSTKDSEEQIKSDTEKKEKEMEKEVAQKEVAEAQKQHAVGYREDALHDIYAYDKRGRMVRAFPTFLMLLIDEGRYVGGIKLSDHFFHYHLIEEITFTNNRKDAISSAEILINNFAGSLDDETKIQDHRYFGFSDLMKQIFSPGYQQEMAANSRERHEDFYRSIYLTTGTRVHLRMGYGSDPESLPVLMNGPITTIQNQDEHMSITVIDDGHELTNKLKVKPNDFSDAGILWARQEPTQIVDEILTDDRGILNDLLDFAIDKSSHSHGIVHFGETNISSKFRSFMNRAVAGGPVGLVGGAMLLDKDTRHMAEVNMNIYQTTGLDNEEHNKFWNKVSDHLGIGEADEDGIRINLFDKTPWDVLNITAAIGHDHYVAVHPFDFRSTVFSGKLHFPIIYGYNGPNGGIKQKTFRQYKFYDSFTTIIGNSIKADAENIKTVASGFYMDNGKIKNTPFIYVDKSIYAEKQKLVNVDTTLHAKGAWLLDKIPIVGKMINKPIKWKQDQGVALKISVSALRDYMKDMYGGYLTVMGDPSAKPFDLMWLDDSYTKMNGPAEIKEVTHMISADVGFISMIQPDLVVVSRDTTVINEVMSLSQVATAAIFQFVALKIARKTGYTKYTPVMHSLWALTKGLGKGMVKTFKLDKAGEFASKYGKKGYEESRKYFNERTLRKWKSDGTLDKMNELAGGKMNIEELIRAAQEGKISKQNMRDLKKLKEMSSPGIKTRMKDLVKSMDASILSRSKGIMDGKGKFKYDVYKKVRGLFLKGGILDGIKSSWKVGRVARMFSIPGWISLAVESLFIATTSSFINELFERSALQNRAIIMVPLKRGERHFLAGVDGHRGSVVGDSPTWTMKMMNEGIAGMLANFGFGVDTSLWGVPGDYDTVSVQSKGSYIKKQDIVTQFSQNFGGSIQGLFDTYRPQPYKVDSQGIRELEGDAIKALNSSKEELETERKRRSFREYLKDEYEKLKEKIRGWFKGFFDHIMETVDEKIENAIAEWEAQREGADEDGNWEDGVSRECVKDMNGPPAGKAVGLSKHFKVLGPKIQKEAKKQGVQAYTEVLKAIAQRESGGNYIRYPDVMQASESRGYPPNYIKSVDLSIKYGVEYFKKALKAADFDLMTVFQSYNFGLGFASWLKKGGRGGRYTEDLAYQFSAYMVRKMGRRISRIAPGYGDSKYAQRILKENFNGKLPRVGNCDKPPAENDPDRNKTNNKDSSRDTPSKPGTTSGSNPAWDGKDPTIMPGDSDKEITSGYNPSKNKPSGTPSKRPQGSSNIKIPDSSMWASSRPEDGLGTVVDEDTIKDKPEYDKGKDPTSIDNTPEDREKRKDRLCPIPLDLEKQRTRTTEKMVNVVSMHLEANGLKYEKRGQGLNFLRPGTIIGLRKVGRSYKRETGEDLIITSMFRPGAASWHSTGWSVDLAVPETMRFVNGKLQYVEPEDIKKVEFLVEELINVGFEGISMGDWNIVNKMNKKFKRTICRYDAEGKMDHIHIDYPTCEDDDITPEEEKEKGKEKVVKETKRGK